jgi:hypothetical protein
MTKFANKIIGRNWQLKADIYGVKGNRVIIIELDYTFTGSVKEWGDSWYDRLSTNGPTENSIKIGESPEEALDWWIDHHGFKVEEQEGKD